VVLDWPPFLANRAIDWPRVPKQTHKAIQGQLALIGETDGKHSEKPCLVTVVKVPVPLTLLIALVADSPKQDGWLAIHTRIRWVRTRNAPCQSMRSRMPGETRPIIRRD